MTDKQIDRLLSRIEWEHQDELNMVNQFNLDYFSTNYLEEIYAHWYERSEKLRAFYRSTLQFAFLASAFMLAGIVGMASNIDLLMPFLYVASLVMFGCFVSLVYLNRNFGSIRHNEYIGDKIRAELRRRYNTLYI